MSVFVRSTALNNAASGLLRSTAIVSLIVSGSIVQAQDLTFDAGAPGGATIDPADGNWNLADVVWNDGTPVASAFTDNTNVIFNDGGAPGVYTVTVDATVNAGNITFDSAGFVIADGGGQIQSGAGETTTITVNADAAIGADISGTFIQAGTATLAYTGTTTTLDSYTINGGTFANSGSMTNALVGQTGDIINNGGTFTNTGTVDTYNQTAGISNLEGNVTSDLTLGAGTTTITNNLIVGGTLNNAVELTFGNAVSANDVLNTGTVTIQNGGVLNVTGAGEVFDNDAGNLNINTGGQLNGDLQNDATVDMDGTIAGDVTNDSIMTLAGGVTGAVDTNSSLTVDGVSTIGTTLDITGTAVVNDALTVTGLTTNEAGGNLDINAAFGGNIDNDGIMTLAGDVTGSVDSDNSLTVDGASSISSTLDITGTAVVNDALTVTGLTTNEAGGNLDINNGVAFGGNIDNDGIMTLHGAVTGTVDTSNSVTIDGASSISSTLDITSATGAVIVGSNLAVTGQTTVGANALLDVDAMFTGNVTNNGNLDVDGNLTGDVINTALADNAGTITGLVTSNGGTFTNTGTAGAYTQTAGASNLQGNVTNNLTLSAGTTTITDDLTVGGVLNNAIVLSFGDTISADSVVNTGTVTIQNMGILNVTGAGQVFDNDAGNLNVLMGGQLNGDVQNDAAINNVGGISGLVTNNLGGAFTNTGTVGAYNQTAGLSNLQGNVTNNLTLGAGTTTITDTLTVGGALNNAITLTFNDTISANSVLNTGDVTIQNLGALNVTGAGQVFDNDTGNLNVLTGGALNGNLQNDATVDMDGTIVGNIVNDNIMTLDGAITGGLDSNSNLTVDGISTISTTLDVSGLATVNQALTVTGLTTNDGTLDINAAFGGGIMNSNILDVDATITGGVTNSGNMLLAGDVTAGVNSSNVLTVDGASNITGLLSNSGTVNANNTLSWGTATNSGTFNVGATTVGTGSGLLSNSNQLNMVTGGTIASAVQNNGTVDVNGSAAMTQGMTGNGLVQMHDGAANDTLTITGPVNSSGLTFNIDLDLSVGSTSGDTVVVNGGPLTGNVALNFDTYGAVTGTLGGPITVVDYDAGQANSYNVSSTGLGISGTTLYYLSDDLAAGELNVLSVTDPNLGGLAGAVVLTQSMIGSIVNRPSSPFVVGTAIPGDDPCGEGVWGRQHAGRADASADITSTSASGERVITSEVAASYRGIQLGADMGCTAGYYNGWDLSYGGMIGYNEGITTQPVYSFNVSGELDTSAPLSINTTDFSQVYAGAYVSAYRDGLLLDLQYRLEDVSFDLTNSGVTSPQRAGVIDQNFGSQSQTLGGTASYQFTLNEEQRLNLIPIVGFSYTQTSVDPIQTEDGPLVIEDFTNQTGFVGATLARTVIDPGGDYASTYFGTLTIYDDFAGDINSTLPGSNISTTNLGQFSELSLGFNYIQLLDGNGPSGARQLNASVRVDGKLSDRLESWGVTGQVRINF